MSNRLRKWMVGAFLLGGLALAGAPSARAQYRYNPNEPRPGTRGDYLEDQQQLRILQDRIWRDKEELRADIRRFGKRSVQVRAYRDRLQRDERDLKRLKQDMKRDRRLAQRRNYR